MARSAHNFRVNAFSSLILESEDRENLVIINPKWRWGKRTKHHLNIQERSLLSAQPVFLHWRAHSNKQCHWRESEPFHVHCGSISIFACHIPQICGSPWPGTAPRNVLALPLVLRTLWKNALHLNYFDSNDSSLTNVTLITLFDSLSPAIMNAYLSFIYSQPKGRPTVDLLNVIVMRKCCTVTKLKPW